MWFLLAALAVAAPPPGVELEDVAPWEAAAKALSEGPAGCWEYVGRAKWSYDVGRFFQSHGAAIFVGRLEGGVWTDFHIEPVSEIRREGPFGTTETVFSTERRFVPMLGKMPPRERSDDEGSESADQGDKPDQSVAVNVLETALTELSDVEVTWAQWDDVAGEVVLHRQIPLSKGGNPPEALALVRFPGGGTAPSAMDVTFEPFWAGDGPVKAHVTSAQVQLRSHAVAGHVFPSSEAFNATAGVLGTKVVIAQTITYRSARRCPAAGVSLKERYGG